MKPDSCPHTLTVPPKHVTNIEIRQEDKADS
jgi:hypothetical protein